MFSLRNNLLKNQGGRIGSLASFGCGMACVAWQCANVQGQKNKNVRWGKYLNYREGKSVGSFHLLPLNCQEAKNCQKSQSQN